ncbi:hypothetical protein F2P56_019679 [Juglans regia]|uniref:Exo_endo_phos domain-containing protein n=1 Tax=Juglans regia TaxID=51240 RepID=A0A833X4E0_JUGRE|nr:hypothetical protein F2P56_019679 [Juglans regia]
MRHWFLTAIYGFPETHLWHQTWRLLRLLCRANDDPWMVMGYFNELMYSHEKCGGRPRPDSQLYTFREVVEDYNLRDLGFSGLKFTWSNRRHGDQCISERIDRFLVNSVWLDSFPNARVAHGVVAYSDHLPIWVNLEGPTFPRYVKKSFKFEAMWVGEKACEDIIKGIWEKGVLVQLLWMLFLV